MSVTLGPGFSQGIKGVGKFAGDKALDWVKGEGALFDIRDYFREETENYRTEGSRRAEEHFVKEADNDAKRRQRERDADMIQESIDQSINQTTDEQVERLRMLFKMQIQRER